MKVYIGPYTNWIGPYQIADFILFWMERDDDRRYKLGTMLDKVPGLTKLCQWIDNFKKRKIKIKIHDYDLFNADSTLSLIILPLMQEFKKIKIGCPYVDNCDVPEHLRGPELTDDSAGFDDGNWERWAWVIDEIIWTFEQLQPDNDWEGQYHTGKISFITKECQDSSDLVELVTGPDDTHKFDKEGWERHNNRINNGLMLFGKYYRALWT